MGADEAALKNRYRHCAVVRCAEVMAESLGRVDPLPPGGQRQIQVRNALGPRSINREFSCLQLADRRLVGRGSGEIADWGRWQSGNFGDHETGIAEITH